MQKSIQEKIIDKFKKVNKVLLMGAFGIEGKSFLKFFKDNISDRDISIYDFDQEKLNSSRFSVSIKNKYSEIEDIDFEEYDLIIRSAGLPKKQIPSKYHEKVENIVSLFLQLVDTSNVYAVTGTKGKGTTCGILQRILSVYSSDVLLAGNIGIGVLDLLPKIKKNTKIILEISSFQAQDLRNSPKYVAILKVTSDHLDKHIDLKDYHQSKGKLCKFQHESDLCVFNNNNEVSKTLSNISLANKASYRIDKFESKEPRIFYDKANHVLKFYEEDIEQIITLESFKLPGEHNLENLMAALLLCKDLWKDKKHEKIRSMMQSLLDFTGLPMHQEKIDEIDDVTFINDSYSINAECTIAALNSYDKPIVLIMGGEIHDDIKTYEPLFSLIQEKKVRQVILNTKNTEPFEVGLRNIGYHQVSSAYTIDENVRIAKEIANPGEIVLFSPGAKSFDLYSNFVERGEKFNEAVKRLL